MVTEQFVRNSDNQIKLTLTEDGSPIAGEWDALDIFIGDDIQIHRDADGNGVTLSTTTGLLTINPGDLTTDEKAALDELRTAGYRYRVRIVVFSAVNDDGAVFGNTSGESIYFVMSDNPSA